MNAAGARRCSRSTTSAAASPTTLALLALGRQPAEGRDRARDRRGAEGADRRAADARARRRRDRVRPPPADRAARRRPRRAARLARARGDPLAARPRAGHLRRARSSPSCRPTRRRRSSAWRCSAGRCRRDADGVERRGGRPGHRRLAAVGLPARRRDHHAAPHGADRVLRRRARRRASPARNPFDTYKAIFDGSGLNWLFPWITGDDRTLAALNLQQTLILTTPLILTGLAVALRVPRRPVQHRRPGPVLRRLASARSGSARRSTGMPGLLHIVLAIVARRAGRRAVGRDRRLPEGDDRAPTR